jgi:hypothetical protein
MVDFKKALADSRFQRLFGITRDYGFDDGYLMTEEGYKKLYRWFHYCFDCKSAPGEECNCEK